MKRTRPVLAVLAICVALGLGGRLWYLQHRAALVVHELSQSAQASLGRSAEIMDAVLAGTRPSSDLNAAAQEMRSALRLLGVMRVAASEGHTGFLVSALTLAVEDIQRVTERSGSVEGEVRAIRSLIGEIIPMLPGGTSPDRAKAVLELYTVQRRQFR